MTLTILASSSAANCALISTSSTRILVDCGLSQRKTVQALMALGVDPQSLTAVLISHEHQDHAGAAEKLQSALDVPVYVAAGAATVMPFARKTFPTEQQFSIGDIEVIGFEQPHDAADPVGYSFYGEGRKISIATDLGWIPESTATHLVGSDLLMIESNYDQDMLAACGYPWKLKERIMSRSGHLSNDVTCAFAKEQLDGRTKMMVLGHLSEQANHRDLARLLAENALTGKAIEVRMATEVYGVQL